MLKLEILSKFLQHTLSLTAAPSPSPHISEHVSLLEVVPPVQVHPVSAFHARFYMKSSWILQPIGILSDVRSAPDNIVCTEICGDGIRFNSISTYCDGGNVADCDECQGHHFYSKLCVLDA